MTKNGNGNGSGGKGSGWGRGLKVQPSLLVEVLGSKMYADAGACLWEPVRNGLVACMPDPNQWTPDRTHVEVSVVSGHPLHRHGRSLVIFDRGTGFTEPNIERFLDLGTTTGIGRHGGASQKQIGRMALFALSVDGATKHDIHAPVYLFTRTSNRGPITMLTLSPMRMCENKLEEREIREDANELGAYKGHRGSFSMFVIPNTVFASDDDVREALAWRIPRLQDKSVNLLVGGSKLLPPKLAKHKAQFGKIKVCIERAPTDRQDGGIWLCDEATGIRCAFAPAMASGPSPVPYPVTSANFSGDVFIPDLLRHQRSDRGGLDAVYLKSAAWKEHLTMLRLQVAPFVQQFLSDDDVFKDRDPTTKAWEHVMNAFNTSFGTPDMAGLPIDVGATPDIGVDTPGNGKKKPNGGHGDGSGTKPTPGDGSGAKPRRRAMAICIEGVTYFVMKIGSTDPHLFGTIGANERVIQWNPDYRVLQRLKGEQAVEHLIGKVIDVVTSHTDAYDYEKRTRRSASIREQLLDGATKASKS